MEETFLIGKIMRCWTSLRCGLHWTGFKDRLDTACLRYEGHILSVRRQTEMMALKQVTSSPNLCNIYNHLLKAKCRGATRIYGLGLQVR